MDAHGLGWPSCIDPGRWEARRPEKSGASQGELAFGLSTVARCYQLYDELLQFVDEAGGGSGKWWTSLDDGDGMSSIDDVHQRLALLQRNAVRVVRIPPGEDVAFLYGRAAPQTGRIGATAGAHFPGGGEQFRLLELDEAWVVASRAIP